jgi:hypothetical protein
MVSDRATRFSFEQIVACCEWPRAFGEEEGGQVGSTFGVSAGKLLLLPA